jgi:hypothetical protein
MSSPTFKLNTLSSTLPGVELYYKELYGLIIQHMLALEIISADIFRTAMQPKYISECFDSIFKNTKRKGNLSYFSSGTFEFLVTQFNLSAPGEAGFETPPPKFTGSLDAQKLQHQSEFFNFYKRIGAHIVLRNEAYPMNGAPLKGDNQNRSEFAFLTTSESELRCDGFEGVDAFHTIYIDTESNTMFVNFHNSSGHDGPTATAHCLEFVDAAMSAFDTWCVCNNVHPATMHLVFMGDANVTFSPENTTDITNLATAMSDRGYITVVNQHFVRSKRIQNIFSNQQALVKPGGQEMIGDSMVVFYPEKSPFFPGADCIVVNPWRGGVSPIPPTFSPDIVDAFSATQDGVTADNTHILSDHMPVSLFNKATGDTIVVSNEASIRGSRGKSIRGDNLCPDKHAAEIIPILNQFTEDIKQFYKIFIQQMIELGLFNPDDIVKVNGNLLKLLKVDISY